MTYSIYDYLLPSLLPYILSVVFVLGFIGFILSKQPKSAALAWCGCALTVGIMGDNVQFAIM